MLLRCRARLQLTPHRMVLMRTYYIIESPPQATPPQFNSFAFLNFQTPTQSQLFVFLSIFMLLGAAHADESAEIALHNGDVRGDLSVVKNWTLICEQLCRWVVLVKLQNLCRKLTKNLFFLNQQLEPVRPRLWAWLRCISGISSRRTSTIFGGQRCWIRFIRTSQWIVWNIVR